MNKPIISAMLLIGVFAQAQDYRGRVGINTTTPKAAFEISRHQNLPNTQNQGVMFPSFSTAERDQWTDTQEGTMIYNTTKKCLEMYFGVVSGVKQWNCIPDTGSSQSQNITVTPAGFTGSFVAGVQMNNSNTVKFKLTNNSFSAINNLDLSTAVTINNGMANLTVNGINNKTVSLNSGAETTLTYTLTGTPQEGTLTANFSRLGLTAEQSTQVGLGSASFTKPQNDNYVVSLIYNSTSVQGKINNTTNKLTVQIPYTSGQGSYQSFSNKQTSAKGQNNDVNGLTLNIEQGNFGVNGSLTATITVDGDGEYLVKQLAPGVSYDIATFPININGSMTNVVIKGIGGIPDKKFNVMTNGRLEHQFIYLPIQGPDGRTWLNNNLGAEYARVGSPDFSPTTQAGGTSNDPNTIKRDFKAYGSLFEFGRDSDGHELVSWTSSTNGTFANSSLQNYNWNTPNNPTGSNKPEGNPCPTGYRTPTKEEYQNLINLIGTGSQMWNETKLKLPAAGHRDNISSTLYHQGSLGGYWSSAPNASYGAWSMNFSSGDSTLNNYYYRTHGFSVRCIKN